MALNRIDFRKNDRRRIILLYNDSFLSLFFWRGMEGIWKRFVAEQKDTKRFHIGRGLWQSEIGSHILA